MPDFAISSAMSSFSRKHCATIRSRLLGFDLPSHGVPSPTCRQCTSFIVELTCRGECLRIPIFDERKLIDRENTILPEVDQALIQTLSDQLLFEEYGGRIAADDPDVDSAGELIGLVVPEDEEGDDTTGTSRSESYAVPAFVLARRHLAVVDIWVDAVKDLSKPQAGDFRRKLLRRDGELLVQAFGRQAERDGILGPTGALGAGLAAEEIAIRLKHLPEE